MCIPVFFPIIFFASLNARHQVDASKFVGTWEVQSASVDGKEAVGYRFAPITRVGRTLRIDAGSFKMPFRKGDWSNAFDDAPWGISYFPPGRVAVYWCVGIYKFEHADELWLCIEYHGQGVEGEAARRWRAPEDFVVREGQHHLTVVLKRK